MSDNDQMTIDERRKYLRTMKKRYVKANSKRAKGLLLNEMEAITGLDCKTLIRLMNSGLKRKPRSRERGAIYGPDVDDALRVIYQSWDYILTQSIPMLRLPWNILEPGHFETDLVHPLAQVLFIGKRDILCYNQLGISCSQVASPPPAQGEDVPPE